MKIEQAIDTLQELQEPFCVIEREGVTDACRLGANALRSLDDVLEWVRIYTSDDGTEDAVLKRLSDAHRATKDEIRWQTMAYNGSKARGDDEYAQTVWERIKNLNTAMACIEAVINASNSCGDRETDSKCRVALDWMCCKRREGIK